MHNITRRNYLKTASASVAGAALAATATQASTQRNKTKNTPLRGGIVLNDDNNRFFYIYRHKRIDEALLHTFVDQYANTQVRELLVNPNAMRVCYDSKVFEPYWKDFDPKADENQQMFQSAAPAERKGAYEWIKAAWQLHQDGIDPYKVWLARIRQKGMEGWISMRMNDNHSIANVQHYFHSDFWRNHPEYWRANYRLARQPDHAFDFGHKEVRDYHFNLVKEYAERYDMDGLELDWMRFGYHFKFGHEEAGQKIMTDFNAATRDVLDFWGKKRGRRIKLSVRMPSRPHTALWLGYDAATWADRKLVDKIVVTPFWSSTENDMPIELWKQLLRGTGVTLAAGLEVNVRTHFESKQYQRYSLEALRGAAAAMLDRGADQIYLFNFTDEVGAIEDMQNFKTIFREVGDLQTMVGKPRRHIITFTDTWAPGEPIALALPRDCKPGAWEGFRIPIGPAPTNGEATAYLGIEDLSDTDLASCQVYVNGAACKLSGKADIAKPKPETPVYRVTIPRGTVHRGYNFVDFSTKTPCKITWVELAVG